MNREWAPCLPAGNVDNLPTSDSHPVARNMAEEVTGTNGESTAMTVAAIRALRKRFTKFDGWDMEECLADGRWPCLILRNRLKKKIQRVACLICGEPPLTLSVLEALETVASSNLAPEEVVFAKILAAPRGGEPGSEIQGFMDEHGIELLTI